MKKINYITILVILLISTGCDSFTGHGFLEPWVFSFDGRQWVLVDKQSSWNKKWIKYYPAGQDVQDHTELIYSIIGEAPPNYSVYTVKNQILREWTQYCSQVEFNVIKGGNSDIVVEFRSYDCGAFPGMHGFYHGTLVGNTVYVLSYSKKTQRLSNDERKKWQSIIENAYLKKAENVY